MGVARSRRATARPRHDAARVRACAGGRRSTQAASTAVRHRPGNDARDDLARQFGRHRQCPRILERTGDGIGHRADLDDRVAAAGHGEGRGRKAEPAHGLGKPVVVREDHDLTCLRRLGQHAREPFHARGVHGLHRVVDPDEPERALRQRGAREKEAQRERVKLALAHHAQRLGGRAIDRHRQRRRDACCAAPASSMPPRSTLLCSRSCFQIAMARSATGANRSSRIAPLASFHQASASFSSAICPFATGRQLRLWQPLRDGERDRRQTSLPPLPFDPRVLNQRVDRRIECLNVVSRGGRRAHSPTSSRGPRPTPATARRASASDGNPSSRCLRQACGRQRDELQRLAHSRFPARLRPRRRRRPPGGAPPLPCSVRARHSADSALGRPAHRAVGVVVLRVERAARSSSSFARSRESFRIGAGEPRTRLLSGTQRGDDAARSPPGWAAAGSGAESESCSSSS